MVSYYMSDKMFYNCYFVILPSTLQVKYQIYQVFCNHTMFHLLLHVQIFWDSSIFHSMIYFWIMSLTKIDSG